MGRLRPSDDDPRSADYALDHSQDRWGGFSDSQYAGCEVASEEAALDATGATGKPFGTWLTGDEFDEAVIEGESWADNATKWIDE